MNADHALLSGEVKRSVSIEMQRQQPSLSLHFLPVVCIFVCTFSYSGGGGGGGRWSQRKEANFPLVYRASLISFRFDFFQVEQPLRIIN